MLRIDDSVFVLVDVQGKLAEVMYERAALFSSLEKILRGAMKLGVPVIWAEQNPARMGPTIPPLRDLLEGQASIAKMTFSCAGEPAFMARLGQLGRRQVLIGGIEAHVCVHQTAADLIAAGYEVHVLADGVSSRTARNREIALQRMAAEGAKLTSIEMALFELLRTAEHPAFKDLLRLVK